MVSELQMNYNIISPDNEYNWIPTIAIGGNEYHVRIITKAFQKSDEIRITNFGQKVPIIDFIYWIGGPGPSVRKFPIFWVKNRPLMILHWIGTDVLNFTRNSQRNSIRNEVAQEFMRLAVKFKTGIKGIFHLSGAPWLANELATCGINARYFPITTIDFDMLKNPFDFEKKDIDFLSYVPFNRFEFYGGDKILELAQKYPQYKFVIVQPDITVANGKLPDKIIDNLLILPKQDFDEMQELYLRSKCFLRITKHDGLSLSVLEALFYNLRVYWTYPFPHTEQIININDFRTKIPEIIDQWKPNVEGHRYVVNNFSMHIWKRKFVDLIYQLAGYS